MKRIAVLILALALMLTGSALAVYDPAASTPTMWDGEVTTITFTSRLPNIVLENNPVLKRVEEAVGVRLEISVLDAAQYNSLIAVQIAGGDVPDMFYLWDNSSNESFQKWAAEGLLWDLEELKEKKEAVRKRVAELKKVIARLKEQAGIHSQVVGYVLDAVADAIHVDDDMQIYTSGATNIFKYPELSDNQSAQEIISAFEEKQQLSELVTQTLAQDENTGIQVYIGDETPVQTMRDCSVVTATYELGDGMKGTIGIIGPKRMDYEHVLKSMKRLQTELDQMFHKNDRKVE